MIKFFSILFALACIFAASDALAEPTSIVVHVRSKGAKFVGTSMGGALVTIRDALTGELLAEGKTKGGTGDTRRIMKTPLKSTEPLTTEDTARFEATLEIDEPVFIEVTARGPMAQQQSANRVSATQWVVPGKDITGGDAWMMVLPGMVVDILDPPAHIKLTGLPHTVELQANVTMGCGCPVEPSGIWDAEKMEIRALVKRNSSQVDSLDLKYAGKPSQFKGEIRVADPGTYEVTVYAYDPDNGNTGIDITTFIVGK